MFLDPWFYAIAVSSLAAGLIIGQFRYRPRVYTTPDVVGEDGTIRRCHHCSTCKNTWIEYPKGYADAGDSED